MALRGLQVGDLKSESLPSSTKQTLIKQTIIFLNINFCADIAMLFIFQSHSNLTAFTVH